MKIFSRMRLPSTLNKWKKKQIIGLFIFIYKRAKVQFEKQVM